MTEQAGLTLPRNRPRQLAWGLAVLGGLLATVLPQLLTGTVSDWPIFALSIVGGVILWAGAMWDEHIRHQSGRVDERFAQIHYRAGWNAFWATLAIGATAGFALGNTAITVPVGYLIATILGGGFLIYLVSQTVYRRRM